MFTLRPILIAEDNANDAELTLAALQRLKLDNELVIVRDGAEALDFLHCRAQFAGRSSGQPAVILLDLKMPRVDGLETLRLIRADAELRTLPVVILTSSREESDLIKGYQFGANSYVVKPVDFDQFTAAISHVGVFWASINEPPPSATRAS